MPPIVPVDPGQARHRERLSTPASEHDARMTVWTTGVCARADPWIPALAQKSLGDPVAEALQGGSFVVAD
jgi:hypothetical protein